MRNVEFQFVDDGYGYGSFQHAANATPIPNQSLIPFFAADAGLVPGTGTDALGDSAIDGGPGPYTPEDPPPADPDNLINDGPVSAPGDGNSLDGFTLRIDGLDEGDTVVFNWQLLAASGFAGEETTDCTDLTQAVECFVPIGSSIFGGGTLNNFGFGTFALERLGDGGAAGPSGPLFAGGAGFNQNPESFFGDVYDLKNPTGFALEFGGGQRAPDQNPDDNLFNIASNTVLAGTIPEPGTLSAARSRPRARGVAPKSTLLTGRTTVKRKGRLRAAFVVAVAVSPLSAEFAKIDRRRSATPEDRPHYDSAR